jgi:mono/diheme cytochrome c family protein/cytochrome c553
LTGTIQVVVVVILAVAFGYLAWRAWRLRNLALKIIAGLLTTLLTIVCAIVGVLGLLGAYKINTPHGAAAATLTATSTPDRLAAAQRRVNGCTGCHSTAGAQPLDGGADNFLGGPLGTLYAPNLTPGGPLKDWSDGEVIRAIREGIDKDGHPLIIMPSDALHHLSDDDVETLVAYLRQQPAINRQTPTRDIGVMGLVLIGAGLFPTADQPHVSGPQTAPPPGTPEYGQYLVDITGCAVCHGPDLRGRAPGGFGPPAGPSLRAIVPRWQQADFVKFFRTGVDPNGRNVDTNEMPWKDIGLAYTDEELGAMYAYLRGLT